jgi:hypothetical protein
MVKRRTVDTPTHYTLLQASNSCVRGWFAPLSNQKNSSKGSRAVDFASGFIMIIKSTNFRFRDLLKARISIQNNQFENSLNQFF